MPSLPASQLFQTLVLAPNGKEDMGTGKTGESRRKFRDGGEGTGGGGRPRAQAASAGGRALPSRAAVKGRGFGNDASRSRHRILWKLPWLLGGCYIHLTHLFWASVQHLLQKPF